jgi:anti-sigma-K factor RskA
LDQIHVIDEIPAYALGILEPEDALRVSNHLAACIACQAEWKAYQEVVGGIALTVPQITPPARVKTALLSKISPQPEKSSILELIQGWLFGRGAVLRLAVAALILVLAASNVLLLNQVSKLNQMSNLGYGSVLLKSTENAPGATGMVVYTTDGKFGFLVVNGLQKLQSDQQYQLWLIKGQQRTSGGIFSVGAEGYFVMEVEPQVPLTAYDGFGITIEPAGGSPGPTGKRVLAGSF